MKFLEGKTPAERNKTVAAMVLGSLAVIALSYTFLFSGASSPKKTAANSNSNVRVAVPVNRGGSDTLPDPQIPTVAQVASETDITPIPENPFPPTFGGETSRNIFALYEPPPFVLKPIVVAPPSPIPIPTPFPISVQFVNSNPNPVYAQQGDFTLEVGGDKFTSDSKVLFNGQEIPTQFAGAQRLTAQVPAALIATEGQRQIMVRTADGSKISNVMIFNVQAPPVPNYNFVGLVAPKRFNNVTALLQDKQSKEYKNVRLGEAVGRFKVVSISSKEVIMQDTALSFRHSLPFVDERTAKTGGNGGRQNPDYSTNNFPGIDPNNLQTQPCQPVQGFPNQCFPQQPQIQQPPKKDPNDDDDNDNN